MSAEEISIIVEALLGSQNDTITKVYYGNKTHYGFFSPADDYELLKRANRWRITPNESSQMFVDGESKKTDTDKKFSLILNGDSISKIDIKTISVTK